MKVIGKNQSVISQAANVGRGPRNGYQLEESKTKSHSADQRASKGKREKHRVNPGRVKSRIWIFKSTYCNIFSDGRIPCVKDAGVRRNLGIFFHVDKPVLVLF